MGRFYLNAASILIEVDSIPEVEDYIKVAKKEFPVDYDSRNEIAIAEFNLAHAYIKSGQYEIARKLLDEKLKYYKAKEDTFWMARVIDAQGCLAFSEGHYKIANRSFRESIDLFNSLGNEKDIRIPKLNLAESLLREGNIQKAIEVAEGIQFNLDSDNPDDAQKREILLLQCYESLGSNQKMKVHENRLDLIKQKQIKANPKAFLKERETLNAHLVQKESTIKRNQIGISFIAVLALGFLFWIVFSTREGRRRLKNEKIESEAQALEKTFHENIASILKDFTADFEAQRSQLDRTLHDEICPRIISVKRELEYLFGQFKTGFN